jgi:hypothetical protein
MLNGIAFTGNPDRSTPRRLSASMFRSACSVGIELVVPAGSTMALVGDTGAGKSTIFRLGWGHCGVDVGDEGFGAGKCCLDVLSGLSDRSQQGGGPVGEARGCRGEVAGRLDHALFR